MLCHVGIALSLRGILLVADTLYRYFDQLTLRIAFRLMGKEVCDDVINYRPIPGLSLDSMHR